MTIKDFFINYVATEDRDPTEDEMYEYVSQLVEQTELVMDAQDGR